MFSKLFEVVIFCWVTLSVGFFTTVGLLIFLASLLGADLKGLLFGVFVALLGYFAGVIFYKTIEDD